MKNTVNPPIPKTDPRLFEAYELALEYARATEAMIYVLNREYLPIAELSREIYSQKNTCLICLKYKNGGCSGAPDMSNSHCRPLHINAAKEAACFGGSYIYMCELGFMFWTSPVYTGSALAGTLMGTGFLGIDRAETREALSVLSGGEIPGRELDEHLKQFPQGEPERIKSMAELLQICAENSSQGCEGYQELLKRRGEQQISLAAEIRELKAQYPPGTRYPGYPLDKERMLLAAIRRGDGKTGRKILNSILASLLFSNPDQFKFIQFRALELVVLLSRTIIGPSNTEEVVLKVNDQNLKRIQETKNIEELTDELHAIIETMAEQIFSFRGIRHASALKKAERFIWENYTGKIKLQEIAEISGLSAPYFSTIFKEEMGENLSTYLNRLRVEKASRMLIETGLSLSDISGSCGFEDQSWFSKIFKQYTGVSPGKFRDQGGGGKIKISADNFSQNYRALFIEKK
ncbi:MAG: helix-turn-helix domain-containing protein [Treponema sp.]|nr:helix-turn-helix domain-containing protein [Treponema sp.]